MRKTTIASLAIVVVGVLSAGGLFLSQYAVISSRKKAQASITADIQQTGNKLQAAQKAAKIDTSTWTKFCETGKPICFKYPKDWVAQVSQDNGRVGVQVQNSQHGPVVKFIDPLVKDGGPASAHIVSKDVMTVGGKQVVLVGTVPVSSGVYSASYDLESYVNPQSLTVGKIGLMGVPSRFDAGTYTGLYMSATPDSDVFGSQSEATAWLGSIDGQTARQILLSLTVQ